MCKPNIRSNATGDDDTFLFSMRGLPTPVSWLGNHTESAIAAMAGVWSRYCIKKYEPHMLLLYIPSFTDDYRKPFMELTVSLFLLLALSFHKKRRRMHFLQASLIKVVFFLNTPELNVGIEIVSKFEIILNLDMCLCISALTHIGKSVSLKAHDVKSTYMSTCGLTFHRFTFVSWLIIRHAVNETSTRQQLTAETIGKVKAVDDMHKRKAEIAKHSDNGSWYVSKESRNG
ncbi:hypothetical protein Tco_0570742 [Tanacetum coccineum]